MVGMTRGVSCAIPGMSLMHVYMYTCTHTNADLNINVCGSAHCCGWVVNDSVAMVAL